MGSGKLRLALPKGRMLEATVRLLEDSGLSVRENGRGYRPRCSDDRFDLKILKPQNIVRMVEIGSRDAAFAGHDWVVELGARVEERMDTGLDPVRIVSAIPRGTDVGAFESRRIVVASEYESITRSYLDGRRWDYIFVKSHGATEVFPPDDADMIVDNTATGRTLADNDLVEVDTLLSSTTRLIVNPSAVTGEKRHILDELVVLLRSVLDARSRVMLEMNISRERLDGLLAVLPCMRRPTLSPLAGEAGFAVKAAVPRKDVARLIPMLKEAGATDILEYPFSRVVL